MPKLSRRFAGVALRLRALPVVLLLLAVPPRRRVAQCAAGL